MTEAQARAVILRVRAKYGFTYKQRIRVVWMSCAYERDCLAEFLPDLQQVRNTFGPSWLHRFRP